MKRTIQFVATVIIVALLGSCSTASSSFYTLGPDPALDRAAVAVPDNVVVVRVTVPEVVDRPQVVTRVSANEVRIDEFARWAEPLKSDIGRAIAADLAKLLASDHVTVFDTSQNAEPTWRIRVDVMRFDSEPAVAASIDAIWTIQPPGKQAVITGRSVVREPVTRDGYDALVAAHNRALAAVSRDIAAVIRPPAR